MSSFEKLTPDVRKYIFDLKWGALSPVQEASIPAILDFDSHLLLSAGTASGKTEAAFLPVISDTLSLLRSHLAVLHILPLKALINDQFERIEKMCSYANISVMKWHGDVSSNQKEQWMKSPSGILQITPESLEGLLMKPLMDHTRLWTHLRYIIIDEAHVFFGSDRGVQLRSLIDRISFYTGDKAPRILALSATVNDETQSIRQWFVGNHSEALQVIEPKTSSKNLMLSLAYIEEDETMIRDMYELSRDMQCMVFCNSRSDAEHIFGRLSQINPDGYFIHHSSIDVKEREKTEQKIKQKNTSKSIVCTGTLEMGIDLGAVDVVIQKEATYSVASLKQRIGRTGRRGDRPQILQTYVSSKESLLRAIATLELVRLGWVEPPQDRRKPFDLFVQQLLSFLLETNGASIEMIKQLLLPSVFSGITFEELDRLICHLVKTDLILPVGDQFVIGLSGEQLILEKGIHSVFEAGDQLQLLHGNHPIGMIDCSFAVEENKTILLAGGSWKIQKINVKMKKAWVTPAPAGTGEKPLFQGTAMSMHEKIGDTIMDVLTNQKQYLYLDEVAKKQLSKLRTLFEVHELTTMHRLVISEKKQKMIYLYKGSRIAKTLILMFRSLGYKSKLADELYTVKVEGVDEFIEDLIEKILSFPWEGHRLLKYATEKEKKRGKFVSYLPLPLQNQMTIEEELDIEGTIHVLRTHQWFELEYNEKDL